MKRLIYLFTIFVFLFSPIGGSLAFETNDPYYPIQWYLKKIEMPEALDLIESRDNMQEVVVALLDTGVDIGHPDLEENIWVNLDEIPDNGIDDDANGYIDDVNGWDFLEDEADPNPKIGDNYLPIAVTHGTITAGVIGAGVNNLKGITGINNNKIKVMPLRVLDSFGHGDLTAVIKAINYALENGARVINLSFVDEYFHGNFFNALRKAYYMGAVVVAAAGNEEEGKEIYLNQSKRYPICYDSIDKNMVIGVAGTDQFDKKTGFSNYGKSCIDVSAPAEKFWAVSIFREDNDDFNRYYDGFVNGTSVAAPIVSGLAAIIKSVNPNLTADKIIEIIIDSADEINSLNPEFVDELGGRVNAFNSLKSAISSLESKSSEVVIYKEGVVLGEGNILVAPRSGKGKIKIFNDRFELKRAFYAFGDNFKGGINVASGDVNGDGVNEIVAAVASLGGPQIKIFNSSGEIQGQFFAFDKDFRGGLNIALGDVNNDGKDEIITALASNYSPVVRVYNAKGDFLDEFLAFGEGFRGGVNLTVGDFNNNRGDEIVVAPASKGGPQIRMFNGSGKLLGQFFAFDKDFRGGVNIAVGDVDRDGRGEIIASISSGSEPYVRVFDTKGILETEFLAFGASFRGGVNLGVGDLNGNGFSEILVGAGTGGGPQVRIFNGAGKVLGQGFVYDSGFRGGVIVSGI